MAYLVLMEGQQKGTQFTLPSSGTVTLGRAADNNIVIDDGSSVSGHHCSITLVDGGSCVLRDENSTNGTSVNGERISEAQLFRGDVIALGNLTMIVDGGDIPAREGDPSVSGGVERTPIEINPRTCESVASMPRPRNFGKRRDHNRHWKVIIVLIIIVVLAAMAFFISVSK